MNATEPSPEAIRHEVRKRYGQIATAGGGCGTGCSTSGSCCTPGVHDARKATLELGYSEEDLGQVPEGANLGLGCGNPRAIAGLRPGDTVLDLGSGAGFDAFLAAEAVGPTGRVIGVDMTPEMLAKARENAERSSVRNVEFRLGEIEALPLPNAAVDVIISNCVINLSPSKDRVFAEAFRVLKPGGHLAVSDVVALAPLPDALREDWALYTGCVAGASTTEELRRMLAEAGFVDIRIADKENGREIVGGWFSGQNVADFITSASIEARKPSERV